MIKKIYSLYDSIAKVYLNPITFMNHGEAVRWLTTVVNPKNQDHSNVSLYPEQFILYQIADFNDELGVYENHQEQVVKASNLKNHSVEYTVEEIVSLVQNHLQKGN